MNLIIVTKEELKTLIDESVNARLQTLPEPEKRDELPEWLTRKEVARYLNCSLATVDNYAREGTLIKHYINGLPRFKREEVRKAFER